MDLDARFGFVRWRVAGLALNLLANAVALYGAVQFLRDGTHGLVLGGGLALSAACVALLARPDLRPEGGPGGSEPAENEGEPAEGEGEPAGGEGEPGKGARQGGDGAAEGA